MEKKRRKLLAGIAIAAPAIWVKPMVDFVILPAHASASPDAEPTLECVGEIPEGTPTPVDVEIRADFRVPEDGPVRVDFATLCNGAVVDGPFSINVTTGEFDVGVTPQSVGCNAGDTFSYRATRQDDGCTAECSWPVIPSQV